MSEAATFKALGDPIRLELVRRLSKTPEMVIGDLSKNIDISRQGARKHLQVLADVGLVTFRTEGRETHVTLEPSSLASARTLIAELEIQWAQRLQSLKEVVEKDII